ncbi:hypothetical protein [Salmonella enterica]|uniref:hypothetical protein n=1 Tax=Salmonella enterica TaxID=28901 RepID=UPI000DECD091|nr:hypothetical protein [Salmonella enterica]AXD79092.1 hypothetical protein CHD68_23900 [Salmonella enterica]
MPFMLLLKNSIFKINSLLQSDRESFEKYWVLNYQPKIKLEFRTRISFKTLFKLDDEELVSQIERPILHTQVYIGEVKANLIMMYLE